MSFCSRIHQNFWVGSPFLKTNNFTVKAFKNWPNFLTVNFFYFEFWLQKVTSSSFSEFEENLWVGSLHEQEYICTLKKAFAFGNDNVPVWVLEKKSWLISDTAECRVIHA